MMVIFVSQCQKNALKRSRRILDAYANRIGDNTWQTLITQDGLDTVYKLLKQNASRSTAVSCHWIRSRTSSQLKWVVGNKKKFNLDGYVPVNSTEKDLLQAGLENDWKYLPAISALAIFASLIHDWGKASELFQNKLTIIDSSKNKGDPIRHEWISCVLFNSLVLGASPDKTDRQWLLEITQIGINPKHFDAPKINEKINPFENLPDIATLIAWLVVSHHKLPLPKDEDLCNKQKDKCPDSLNNLLKSISKAWGYENLSEDYSSRVSKCFEFPFGLLSDSDVWISNLKKSAAEILRHMPLIEESIRMGSWKLILHHARLCLMLGDHQYSSKDNDPYWLGNCSIYANTDRESKRLKQKLDEHLVNVAKTTSETIKMLPVFESEMIVSSNISGLMPHAETPKQFKWQDKAVRKIANWREETENKSNAFFVVNMASTGTGKTIANAKVMLAISEDAQSLRYILALGLRTLTLQTGDEYIDKLQMNKEDVAVLIGSKSVFELHESGKVVDKDSYEFETSTTGSESDEELLDASEEITWQGRLVEDELTTVLVKDKDRQFLYAPILVCTIDHIMSATETKRGGKYILPCLRLMSSDLVIDEIDDFTGDDLIAIGRLIYLAGMLGRNVMISSATIPPDLALGLYNSYRQGWAIFSESRSRNENVNCVFVDEFDTVCELISSNSDGIEQFKLFQSDFIKNRVSKIRKQDAKCRAEIFPCIKNDKMPIFEQYYSNIKAAIYTLHSRHFMIDPITQIKVSFGVVRVANIKLCVELTEYLLSCELPDNLDLRCMAYHSQQVLLMRHVQEMHLDTVLKRKEKTGELPSSLTNPVIRRHLDNSKVKQMVFVLIATPVEEVGRDHDFDWAVIEPSSYRSIIQMAGRVRRHRIGKVDFPNIMLLQFNLKGFEGKSERVFNRPGYEVDSSTQLVTHDMTKLVNEDELLASVNSIPRIEKKKVLQPKEQLIDLEHFYIERIFGISQIDANSKSEPPRRSRFTTPVRSRGSIQYWSEHLHGHVTGLWWFTGLPQYFRRFRRGEPSINLYLIKTNDGNKFFQKDKSGGVNLIELTLNIKHKALSEEQERRIWLKRNYGELITEYSQSSEQDFFTSVKYGELSFVFRNNQNEIIYNDQLGLVIKK